MEAERRREASQDRAAGIGPGDLGTVMRLHGEPRRDVRVFASILAGLTIMVIPLSLYVWHRTQPRRDRERRAESGRMLETLARLQA
ncbi:MAG: hypothetical protein ABWY78_16365 [Microvirga sp.]